MSRKAKRAKTRRDVDDIIEFIKFKEEIMVECLQWLFHALLSNGCSVAGNGGEGVKNGEKEAYR